MARDGQKWLVGTYLVGEMAQLLQAGMQRQYGLRRPKDRGVPASCPVRNSRNAGSQPGVQLHRNQIGAGPAGTHQGIAVEHSKDARPTGRGCGAPRRIEMRQNEDVRYRVFHREHAKGPGVGSAEHPDGNPIGGCLATRR
ncbi:hypothetical protein AHiyo8_14220 [Arthrobacter sp. Hiyo8]|nr:hypothetical protein AHiyo8_14220 [Arthrobacter sp. Hiyo8]